MCLDDLVFQAPQTEWIEDPPLDPISHVPVERSEPPGQDPDRRPRLLPVVVVLAAILVTLGCAKAPEHPWVVRDGLLEVDTYNRGKLFIKRDHHLGDYDDLLIDHVGFRYGRGQERLHDGQEDRIVSMLLETIRGSEDGTLGLVTAPGPCVLTVNFFLKDLELEEQQWEGRSATNFVSSYGAATMVLELRDSMDQEPLARFIQRRDLGGGRGAAVRAAGLWRLRHVMAYSLRDMGRELRKVIPPTTGRRGTKCRGALANVALGAL